MPGQRRLAALAVLLLLVSALAVAQQNVATNTAGSAPSNNESTASTQDRSFSANPIELVNGRSLFFPDIARTMGPLSPRQKFNMFVSNSTSGVALVRAAGGAGISQARDTYEGYGQGASGYGKRFGASMATYASSNFFGTFILASALHQDPRFFVREHLNFAGTLRYAAWRLVNTRTDSGGTAPNYSGLLGPLPAEALANTYLPDHERTVGKTFQRYGIDLAFQYGGNIFRQYWPTFFKRLQPVLPAGLNPNP